MPGATLLVAPPVASLAAVAGPALFVAAGAVFIAMATTASPFGHPGTPKRERRTPRPLVSWWRLPLGGAVAVGLWLATGWPAAGVWMGLLTAWVPTLSAKGRQRNAEMAVASGIARLAAMMRDQVLVGADVAEAIRGCVAMAPAAIASDVTEMAERLQGEEPGPALAAFAENVNDPMAELLAVSLRFALTRRTAKLADLFDEVARATEEQVRTRRAIEKDRRRLRTSMWSVMVAVTTWLVVIYFLSGTYLAPYHGIKGQAIMALAGAAFAAGLVGLARMDQISGPKRLRLQLDGQ
ncbi:MAG TPA: hypothetical protein VHT75_17725 [Acidimicrobiales bacterium]|nr:hypothetical protein [Acidimicrobiales bacterium]